MLVLIFLFNLLILILNEVGVFCTDKTLLRISFLIVFILTLTPPALVVFTSLGERDWFAYLVITCAAGAAIIDIMCQNFNAVLCITLPLLIAITYYNIHLIVYGMIASIMAAIVSMYLCGGVSNSAAVFALNMVYVYSPEVVLKTDILAPAVREGKVGLLSGLLVMYALPNCLIILCMYLVVRVIIKIRKQRRDANDTRIFSLKNQVLTAMADIVENRDTSTGGHVKRTTDVVEILINNLECPLSDKCDKYREYVIKAASTHDLGKIAVPDAILKKPGRLTPEEFEKIKIHPVKSEELIRRILGPIENREFLKVAENLARYHHERYDGKGYPNGLAGEDIPLEARIMAVADVYDALVSKRCYKDPITHEEACEIIVGGMGTQFDPALLDTFEKSADRLKEYYDL